MFTRLNRIYDKIDVISSVVTNFNAETKSSNNSSSSVNSSTGAIQIEPECNEIFTQNSESRSSSHESNQVQSSRTLSTASNQVQSPYQKFSNLKDKETRLKDFKNEFEQKFSEMIQVTHSIEKVWKKLIRK